MYQTLREAADALYFVRAEKLRARNEMEALGRQEAAIEQWLADRYKETKGGIVVGNHCKLQLIPTVKGRIIEFGELSEFIAANRKKGAFSLLEERLNQTTFETMALGGIIPPGCKSEDIIKIAYRSLST